MKFLEVIDVLVNVECDPYTFDLKVKDGQMYLVAWYYEKDISTGEPEKQTTRKWYISEHATKSEIVQTALKCVLTSMEHRAREAFTYKGRRVFGPHFDVDALYSICNDRHNLDYRPSHKQDGVEDEYVRQN